MTPDAVGKEASSPSTKQITILVNQRPFHLDEATLTPERIRALAGAPAGYEVWKVVKSPDPEGQLPIDDVQVLEPVDVKSGERFRVLPPGIFGGP